MDSVTDEGNTLKRAGSEVLRSSGSLRLGFTGWSMLPAIWPDDTLEIGSADCANVSAGDVVLFHRDRRLFVHRVVKQAGVVQCSDLGARVIVGIQGLLQK